MNEIILFSPVGGTDPIHLTNCLDGSMLHICRVYKPNKVYMYMSSEILEKQKRDNRYTYCLDKLAEMQKRTIEYEIIERPELKEVQDFDYFYRDFNKIIHDIHDGMDETDTLILNISSGTPAMKSGLLVLNTLGEYPCKTVQVVTPTHKMNEHTHTDYDVESLWELNEDNDLEKFKNRCQEVSMPSLSLLIKIGIIKSMLEKYNYTAAYDIALYESGLKEILPYLEIAKDRYSLDCNKAISAATELGVSEWFPVRSGNEKKYFEYALCLDIKRQRGDLIDFIRGITPLFFDLFEMVLKQQAGIDLAKYTSLNKVNVSQWDREKLAGTEVEKILNSCYKDFNYGVVYAVHMKCLIENSSAEVGVKKTINDLRIVEENIRNVAAHEIVSISEEDLKKKTGFTSIEIMNKIKKVFQYANIKVPKESWKAYEKMNEDIINMLSRILN